MGFPEAMVKRVLETKDLYEVLGLEKGCQDEELIKKAYKSPAIAGAQID